jgi:hypothetical protein
MKGFAYTSIPTIENIFYNLFLRFAFLLLLGTEIVVFFPGGVIGVIEIVVVFVVAAVVIAVAVVA